MGEITGGVNDEKNGFLGFPESRAREICFGKKRKNCWFAVREKKKKILVFVLHRRNTRARLGAVRNTAATRTGIVGRLKRARCVDKTKEKNCKINFTTEPHRRRPSPGEDPVGKSTERPRGFLPVSTAPRRRRAILPGGFGTKTRL